MVDYVPPNERPRPDADLASVTLEYDRGRVIHILGDEAALGRIFMWLMVETKDAADEVSHQAYRAAHPPMYDLDAWEKDDDEWPSPTPNAKPAIETDGSSDPERDA